MNVFRAWRDADLVQISKLEEICFSDERWSLQMLRSACAQDCFYGELCEVSDDAPSASVIVAYGCMQCAGAEADLMTIAVAPDFRRQGLGKALLERLLSGARGRGAETVFLEVRRSNNVAQALYVHAGFRKVAVRKKYYPDGEDALLMRMDFKKDACTQKSILR